MSKQGTVGRHRSSRYSWFVIGALLALAASLSLGVSSAAAAAPAWDLSVSPLGAHFAPGAGGDPSDGPAYLIRAENSGDAPSAGIYAITDFLPLRLTPAAPISGEDDLGNPLTCESKLDKVTASWSVTCTSTQPLAPGEAAELIIPVNVSEGPNRTVANAVNLGGGGAAQSVGATTYTLITTGNPQPAWRLTATSQTTNFASGLANNGRYPLYSFVATNIGGDFTHGPITITATLPPGITPSASQFPAGCDLVAQTLTCTRTQSVPPGQNLQLELRLDVGSLPEGSSISAPVQITGGGAPAANTELTTTISSALPSFGFLPGPNGTSAVLDAPDGSPSTGAGTHPYGLALDLAFPSRKLEEGEITGAGGGLRDLITDFPRGLIVNPTASPVLCTEAQLEATDCPYASAVGIVTVLTTGSGTPKPSQSPLYNMRPPAGTPAELGFNAAGVGIFVHIKGGVRSDGDFGITSITSDILARAPNPVLAVQAQLWGDPSDAGHDRMRANCNEETGPNLCEVEPQPTAFLTLPGECPSTPMQFAASADSWIDPGDFVTATAPITDPAGDPISVDGCNSLEFKPTISVKPTTDLNDSPSGLDVTVHQPQSTELGENGEGRATASLRDATVTLPPGMAVNPSQADGLAGCSAAQIGLTTAVGETPIHFDKSPDSCPDAAKLGKVEVTTPLLAQYSPDGTKPITDPETGEVIPRPLEGAVYLAEPYQNPFDSLLAIYLSINDPQSGTIAKLAGRVIPDPATGRLTTVFEENPQLPLEDVTLHLFGGARGALITPPTCGTHTTTSDLVPWTAPEGESAHPSSSFNTTASPDGGPCPATEAAAPNAPAFSAGTISPQAGAYSPFVLKLSRNDGSQRLTKLETTLPPGLAARFAGVGQCSEAQIAQAQSRSHPNEGALEKASPSCPTSSKLGTVTVGAGAGPTPYYTQGTAYLSGPYKGAPFSLTIITPAIAGPFDLGTVVSRVALYVNPDTAQGRAVSDPLPTILEGIPLDVRSVAIEMDRPGFTLNPTSCDPMAVTGTATSILGSAAQLTSPFQVGGCSSLPFKPKLSLQLKGPTKRTSHPRLIANLSAKPGEANIAKAQVKLPPSAFLDQGHIRTICTRVQFKADSCPPGSIYGKASATTPLLEAPLTGGVYLRSSSHNLPDLVVKLKGPDAQPIEIDLVGRTDSIKGALRNTFEAVPDAPVSKFHLELFGGKRGLVELSSGFCKHPKATVQMDGQNGKTYDTRPVVGSGCKKGKKRSHKRHKRREGA